MQLSYDYIKRNFKFSYTEILFICLSSLIGGFILSFRKWGLESVDINFGIYNLILGILIVALNSFTNIITIKINGLRRGHIAKYSFGKFSSLFSLFIVFLSNGLIPFFSPGTFKSKIEPAYRFGRIPHGLNLVDLSKMSTYGSFSNLIIALIARILLSTNSFTGNYVLEQVLRISVTFAIVSMLPFPEFNGFYTFYCSRLLYIFYLSLISIIGIMLLIKIKLLAILILALPIAIITWFVFYWYWERNFQK